VKGHKDMRVQIIMGKYGQRNKCNNPRVKMVKEVKILNL